MEFIELDDKGKEEASEPLAPSATPEWRVAPNADHYKVVMGNAIALSTCVSDDVQWTMVEAGGWAASYQPVIQLDLNQSAQAFRLTGRLRGPLTYWRSLFASSDWLTRHESYVCPEEQSEIQVFSATLRMLSGGRYEAVGVYQLYEVPAEKALRLTFATDGMAASLHPAHSTAVEGTLTILISEAAEGHACDMWAVGWPRVEMGALASLWHFGINGSLAESTGDALRQALLERQPSAHK